MSSLGEVVFRELVDFVDPLNTRAAGRGIGFVMLSLIIAEAKAMASAGDIARSAVPVSMALDEFLLPIDLTRETS